MRNTSSRRLALVLILTLGFGLVLVPQPILPVHAADASLVFAAYQAIMTHHIERQDPVKLLAGALNGLRQALAKAGVTERFADLGGADETTAKNEFQARFDRAVSLTKGKLTATQLQYAAAGAMAAGVGDSATSFFDRKLWEHKNRGFGKGVAGIGAFSDYRFGRYVVFTVAPYSPAASAGVRRLDRVLAIDGQSVLGMPKDEIDNRIHPMESEGTTIKLTIRRPGQSAPLTFSMVRQRVLRFPPVEHRMLGGHLGYIWLRSLLMTNDAAEFRRALVELQHEGMSGLILDLRLHEAGDLQGLFVANALLPLGVPIQTIVSDAKAVGRRVSPAACPTPAQGSRVDLVRAGTLRMPAICTDTTSGPLLDSSTPIVVLIDETTVGTGETLSTAIRETRRGKLIGARTAGQVGWGDWLNLPGGTGITVESHIVLAGNGTVLDKVGVQPDIVVDLTAVDLDRGVDTQLQRAVQILSR